MQYRKTPSERVTRLRAYRLLKFFDGLDVMIQDVGMRRDDNVKGVGVEFHIRDQRFNGSTRTFAPNRTDSL